MGERNGMPRGCGTVMSTTVVRTTTAIPGATAPENTTRHYHSGLLEFIETHEDLGALELRLDPGGAVRAHH